MAEKLDTDAQQLIASAKGKENYYFGGKDFLIESEDPVLTKEAKGRIATYRDLSRDAKVHACLERRYDMVINAETIVALAPRRTFKRKEDEKMRDMIQYQIDSMGVVIEDDMVNASASFSSDFDGLQYGLLDATLIGYAVGEIMWDTDGKEIYVREVRIRKQERFKADTLHRWRLLQRENFLNGRLLPRRKFLFYTYGSSYDPYGLGLGNRLYWPVHLKRKDLSFWIRMLDKYGGPTAVGKYPHSALKEKQDELLAAAAAMNSDTAVVISEDQNIELVQAISTAAQQGFDQLAKYLDGQISQTILGVTLTTDISGSQGSRAAADTHMHGEKGVGEKSGNSLASFLTSTLCRYITDYNSGVDTPAPRIVKLFPHFDAMKEAAGIDQILFNMGFERTTESVNKEYGRGDDIYRKTGSTLNKPANKPREDQGEPDEEQEREEAQQITSSNGQQ